MRGALESFQLTVIILRPLEPVLSTAAAGIFRKRRWAPAPARCCRTSPGYHLISTLALLLPAHSALTTLPCCSLDLPTLFPPLGFCIGSSLCLESSPPKWLYDSLLCFIQVSAQMPPPQRGLALTPMDTGFCYLPLSLSCFIIIFFKVKLF